MRQPNQNPVPMQGAGPTKPLSFKDSIQIPAQFMPAFRTAVALQNKTAQNLLVRTWGGIGDQVCAEPTLRYALKNFPTCNVSFESEIPEYFSHLKPYRMFNANDKFSRPDYDKFFVFDTIVNSDHIVWQFFSHCLVSCVDFPSMCAFRMQLPIEHKDIFLCPEQPDDVNLIELSEREDIVFVHAGKHWPSKTFPKDWWDDTLDSLIVRGITPVLIGADADDNRGTVDVNTTGCIDLRNKTTLSELAWLLQRAKVLITNDSSPLHIAASRNPDDPTTGKTWIGYIATCKHPDYITHWRRTPEGKMVWQWREENLGVDGMWNHLSNCPNNKDEVKVDQVEESMLRSWLPEPAVVAQWAKNKMKEY